MGLLVLTVIAIIVWIALRVKKETTEKLVLPARMGVPRGSDFFVYNYLNKPVQIDIVQGIPQIFIDRIEPHQRRGVKMSDVVKYLRSGAMFQIYVLDPTKGRILFSNYSIDLPKDATIRALHIGMITSKWVGATQDYKFIPGLNAVQGRPWIKIHNRTALNLHINNNIDISPYGTLRYSGRDHFGVRLGTIFTDQEGIFPSWKFKVPATDVYWGVVSDLQMPLFAGWQIDSEFTDDSDDIQYLLENGFMGGPAEGNIAPGFIPRDGPATAPLDRWGQLPDLPKVC